MENISPFDVNSALRLWLERLGQSPQVKGEDLKELELHLRDSMSQLEMKGLSSEESFIVATHRVGTPEKLEPEFAKVNRKPLSWIIQGLVLGFFSVGCWILWGLLHFPQMMIGRSGRVLPAFTRLIVDCGSYWMAPPLIAAGYLAYIWINKSVARHSWMGFFAALMAALILLTLPTLLAVLLPVVDFMNRVGEAR